MMTGMKNKPFFLLFFISTCIMVPKKCKAKNTCQNYVNASNDNFIIISNVINKCSSYNI
jgi:hypothetical protein